MGQIVVYIARQSSHFGIDDPKLEYYHLFIYLHTLKFKNQNTANN